MSQAKYPVQLPRWWELSLATIISILAWLFLWYFPWQDKLHHIFWLQLGVGLAIFIVPGLCLYGLLSGHSNLELNHITFGFAISHLLFAIFGAAGRLIHLSFEAISFLMMASGLVVLLLYILPLVNRGIKFQMDRQKFAHFLPLLAILLISLLAGLIVIQRILSDDDLTYLAYATNMQYSAQLKFNYPILDESQLASSRFWLMSAPLAQAFLANISGMPGILILGGYYEPYLVLFSALSWYELAITLKLSPRAASASVILQLSFLLLLSEYLHPGSPYFFQLSTDKATAAFILAPIFFRSLIKLLEIPTRNNMLLSLLTGLSLTFMHPIILAYTVFIGGMLVLLNNTRGYRNKIIPIIILIIILSPQVAIRFVRIPGIGPVSFDAEVVLNQDGSDNMITQWRDTSFYGFNLNILSMKLPNEAKIPLSESVITWGWLLIPTLAVVFAIQQREKSIAQFILSCFLLCFLAGFPFTGWIIGYFLNGRMLARTVWLFPYGLSAVYLYTALRDHTRGKRHLQKYKITNIISNSPNWFLFTVTVLAVVLFSSYINENDLLDMKTFSAKSQRYQGLATAGQELDRRIFDYAYVIGSEQLNDLIPGISAKSKPITFRTLNPSHMPNFSKAEVDERISDTKKIFSKSLSPEEKMLLLEKYEIQFLFLQRFDLRLFEDFIARYPERVEAIETGGVVILQINPQNGD